MTERNITITMDGYIADLASKLSTDITKKREDVILKALKDRVGDVEIESLRGRLVQVRMPNGWQKYMLDEQTLVDVAPVQTHVVDDGKGPMTILVSQEYQLPSMHPIHNQRNAP